MRGGLVAFTPVFAQFRNELRVPKYCLSAFQLSIL